MAAKKPKVFHVLIILPILSKNIVPAAYKKILKLFYRVQGGSARQNAYTNERSHVKLITIGSNGLNGRR